MAAKGIKQVVVSPGSRNAPVIILFSANKGLQLLSVADERSAGFFALGLSLKSGHPVALLCTSGSAVLNYAPAIAEAYYQKIPLLVITADRPSSLIDQGDSQTIRQNNIYSNYIRKSFFLPEVVYSHNDKRYFDRLVNEAIDRTLYPAAGPVHINLPLDEPLYDISHADKADEGDIIKYQYAIGALDESSLQFYAKLWNKAVAKIILVGQLNPDSQLLKLIKQLSSDSSVVVLTECTSNMNDADFINCIDRTLALIPAHENDNFKPQILLTLGGAVVSKKIKAMLRDMSPEHHWHISDDPEEFHYDTYKSLTATINSSPKIFLEQLLSMVTPDLNSQYKSKWKEAEAIARINHCRYVKSQPFSDLKAYEHIFNELPSNSSVHLGNSTPVRYAQLFDQRNDLHFYSNRGTSGIDGCSSTAAGFAFNNNSITVLITGDIGFLYDSNALWNENLTERLRIILINNGGGNIFRIIDGPAAYSELETFIETTHDLNVKGIAENFNIAYCKASDEQELIARLPLFFAPTTSKRPAILEIVTDNKISADILREYFSTLRKSKEVKPNISTDN